MAKKHSNRKFKNTTIDLGTGDVLKVSRDVVKLGVNVAVTGAILGTTASVVNKLK